MISCVSTELSCTFLSCLTQQGFQNLKKIEVVLDYYKAPFLAKYTYLEAYCSNDNMQPNLSHFQQTIGVCFLKHTYIQTHILKDNF